MFPHFPVRLCSCVFSLGLSTRIKGGLYGLVGFIVLAASLRAQPTPVTVPTWRYDLTHAGQNTNETELTPYNVHANTFGKLFSLAVDGQTYAQPLYVPGLRMNDGAVHNVLFVATSHDSIYAFDADSNGGANAHPIWKISLLGAGYGARVGATTVPWQDTGSPDVAEIGVTGTPVIDPATNTMYVVAATKESGVYYSRLHAINILNGTEQPHSPVDISATVSGTGNGSAGGKLSFSALWQNQRTPLEFYNGHVYFGYAAHGDDGPWHGWLFAYDATTLAQTAAVCTSPNGFGAGIWSSGAGSPIDTSIAGGRMFAVTGNGSYNSKYPISGNTEFGQSIVEYSLANGGITPVDVYTAYNADALNGSDRDLGAGGALMLPPQQGSAPRELIQAGKEGRIVVVNRDRMGGFAPGAPYNTQVLQDITGRIKGLWSTPAYWNGKVYIWGNGDVPKIFGIDSGVLNPTPISQSTITSAFPGASFSISSYGANNGIAWAVRTDQFNTLGPAVLYAWDANSLSNLLYSSNQIPARDSAGPANKFAVPMVTNGKVYVASQMEVDVYGLFNNQPVASAPVITPNGGTFAANQSVTIKSATSSAAVYYTLDGSIPTPASPLYQGPISVTQNTTVRAIASASGYVQSPVTTAVFTFSNQVPSVLFQPGSGSYASTQQVTLIDGDAQAKMYYTTDGSTPTQASTLYTAPITVSSTMTIKAIAIDPRFRPSTVIAGVYAILGGSFAPTVNFASGFSTVNGLVMNGTAINSNDSRLQLTSGVLHQAGSVFWNQPVSVQSFTTDFEFQLSLAKADGFTFTIQNNRPNILGGSDGALGYAGIGSSVAIKFDLYNNSGEGASSTGVYTNGAMPTLPSIDMTPSGVILGSGDAMQAHVTYNGATLTMTLHDLVTNKTFTFSRAINIPAIVGSPKAYVGFTGATGGFTASQKILTWTYVTP